MTENLLFNLIKIKAYWFRVNNFLLEISLLYCLANISYNAVNCYSCTYSFIFKYVNNK